METSEIKFLEFYAVKFSLTFLSATDETSIFVYFDEDRRIGIEPELLNENANDSALPGDTKNDLQVLFQFSNKS